MLQRQKKWRSDVGNLQVWHNLHSSPNVIRTVKLTFLFSKVLRALTPSGHNDPVCWDVDNCDKIMHNIFFTRLLHEIELINTMSDD